jgi:predicted CopG family antitoxin
MVLKNIKVEEEVWWELNKLKVQWKFKTLSQVVTKIVKGVGNEPN